jgi:hypothetical protein
MPYTTRAQALGSLCAVALASQTGIAAVLAAGSKPDPADIKALAATLALERALIQLYADPNATHLLSPPVLAVIGQFSTDHVAHRDALAQALGAAGQTVSQDVAVIAQPSLSNEGDVLGFAYTLERQLANAHLGSVPSFKNRDYSATAASILGVETTHVALLGEALRQGRAYPSGFVTG